MAKSKNIVTDLIGTRVRVTLGHDDAGIADLRAKVAQDRRWLVGAGKMFVRFDEVGTVRGVLESDGSVRLIIQFSDNELLEAPLTGVRVEPA